jgi:hypothetical protein
MINRFVIQRWIALSLMAFLPIIGFYAGLLFLGLLWAFSIWAMTALFCYALATLLLKNPFTKMLEAKGLLLITLDSTGSMQPFNVGLDANTRQHVLGRVYKKIVSGVFDRNTIFDLSTPQDATMRLENNKSGEEEYVICRIPKKDVNKNRMQFTTAPVFLYNTQLATFYTKDWFGDQERYMYANHLLLYLNKKMEELTSLIRDFARYIAEQLKPKSTFQLGSTFWIWLIIIFLAIVGLYFAWPYIADAFGTATANGKDIIPSGASIIPRG